MVGRLTRLVCTVLIIAVGLITPVLVTMAAPSASADTVVSGCTVVSNPTPTDFTDCPNWNTEGASLDGVDLAYADLAGATFVQCTSIPSCTTSDLVKANLSSANLAGASFANCGVAGPPVPGQPFLACGFSDLTDANLTGANLNNADFGQGIEPGAGGATLTGANFTGTILVPANQSAMATSQTGSSVTWSTPAGLNGADPGACTPASGAVFPLFSTTVTCQVLDEQGGVATGTFQVTVEPTTSWFTRVLVPSDGATLSGASYLDAGASDGPGVTKVLFEISGGSLSDQVVATATPTLYGWLAKWNTTTVANGTYNLQSVATDAAGDTDTSTPASITVSNEPPSTTVLIPSDGASVAGRSVLLDASAASGDGGTIQSVDFLVTLTTQGTGETITNHFVSLGAPTIFGWLGEWDTTDMPNGTYTVESEAEDSFGFESFSSPVSVTVDNPPPTTVLIPSTGASQSGTSALLDATAVPGVVDVSFELSGGTLSGEQNIGSGAATIYGWLAQWNTTSVPDGTYTLQSVALFPNGYSAASPGITVTVNN